MSKDAKQSWMGVAAAGLVLVAVVAAAGWWAMTAGPAEGEAGAGGAGGAGGGAEVWDAQTREQLEEHRVAAQRYIRTDEVPKARAILEALLEQYPEDAEARVLMAKVLMAEGKAAQAYEEINRSLELNGARDDIQFLAGVLAASINRFDKARYHYTQAVVLAPSDARYRMYLGQLLMKTDHLEEAEMQLLKAHALDSSLAQIYAMLAEIAARRGKLDMAIDQVNKALDQVGKEEARRVRYVLLKAMYLRRHNEPEAALRVLRELPAAQQQEPKVVHHMAASYLMMSEPAKAAVVWSNLFDVQPTNAMAAAEAGLCFLRAGDTDSARRYLGLARRIDADEAKVQALKQALAGETHELPGS